MRSWLLSPTVLAVLIVLSSPADAADKDEAKKPETLPVKVQRLTAVGTVRAKIAEMNDNDLKLRITEKVPEVLAAARVGRSYAIDYTLRDKNFDFDVTMIEGVKVRLPIKVELDSRGRPKPPPKKDPKDPDRNLPGTKGSVKDLTVGQWVTVTLAKTRDRQPKLMAVVILVEDGD